ncbi:MAG: ABC transporter permease [Planctomycetota bacterium]
MRGALARRRDYQARAAVVALSLFATALAAANAANVGAAGRILVAGMFWPSWIAVLFVGAAGFGALLAREREEGTLSLLRLTGRRIGTLLLAKAMGPLWTFSTMLLVQIPFAMLGVTLGGVGAGQALAACGLLVAHAARTFGLSLLCSSLARTTPVGVGLAAFALVVTELVLPWAAAANLPWGTTHTSAFAAARLLWTDVDGVWRHAVTLSVLGLVSTLGATGLFARERVARAAQTRARPEPSRPHSGTSAFAWRDLRFVLGGGRALAVYASLSLLVSLVSVAAWYGVVLIVLAGEGTKSLREERRGNTLTLLAITPHPDKVWLAAKRRCQWLLLATVVGAGAPAVWLAHGSREPGALLAALAMLGPLVTQAQRSGLSATIMPIAAAIGATCCVWLMIGFVTAMALAPSLAISALPFEIGVTVFAAFYTMGDAYITAEAVRRHVGRA